MTVKDLKATSRIRSDAARAAIIRPTTAGGRRCERPRTVFSKSPMRRPRRRPRSPPIPFGAYRAGGRHRGLTALRWARRSRSSANVGAGSVDAPASWRRYSDGREPFHGARTLSFGKLVEGTCPGAGSSWTCAHHRCMRCTCQRARRRLGRVAAAARGIVAAMTTFPLALDGIRVHRPLPRHRGPLVRGAPGRLRRRRHQGGGHRRGRRVAHVAAPPGRRDRRVPPLQPEQARHDPRPEVAGRRRGDQALVAEADVLVENFRTGTMESFGLGYDVLAEINPRLIYCSVSAFGRTGPRKDSPGYEALMQAFSGIMSITGEPGGPPVRSAVSFLDLTTGILCALGVTAAVHPARAHRARPARRRLAPRHGREPPRLPRRGLSARRPRPEGARLRAPVALALPQLQVRRRAVDLHRRGQ